MWGISNIFCTFAAELKKSGKYRLNNETINRLTAKIEV
jgi:hypothetical protein